MSIESASHPATQGLPMPRATTAACEVIPPCAVRTPFAWTRPWMSSGVVSQRTRMTLSPAFPRCSAVSASRTTLADAGDDVLALCVLEELAVEALLAGRRITRERDAGRRPVALVPGHHLHDVD